MKTGLVLEGGALRTIFATGVCDAWLDDQLPLPDYFVGVSAGIAYGVSFLSRQSRRNLKIVTAYANDPRYMGLRNLADRSNRSYFGLSFVYDQIPNQLVPFDYDTFEAYPGEVDAVVTNLNTGKAEYLPLPRRDPQNVVLQASCAMPLMFPIFTIDGQPYLDGGCSDPIPWQHALDVGCDRVVVILSRERDYDKTADSTLSVIRQVYRKYPNFVEAMRTRAQRYNECRRALFEAEAAGLVKVIAPEDTLGCSRTERDLEILRGLWQEGYFAGHKAAEEIRAWWQE